MFFSYDFVPFQVKYSPNTVRSCLVKGEKDIYWPATNSQTWARILSSRM